ncbi:MAG: hypothetical protein K1X74_01355 [Pirellulales bacterium]|nr:hypothetical protein [Pirellulales bacterium]
MNAHAQASPAPDDPLAERLVAYLDGELPPGEAQQLEDRLAHDRAAQRELAQLDRTWQLLDSLPPPEVDGRFTRTTLEMVAATAQVELRHTQRWAPLARYGRWVLGVLLLAACGSLGYAGVAIWVPSNNAELLAQLPILERLEMYRQVVELPFLRAVAEVPPERFAPADHEPGTPAPGDAAPPAEAQAAEAQPSTAPAQPPWHEPLEQRRARIAQMPAESKQELQRKRELLSTLPEREQLATLQRELESAPDAAALLAAGERYYAWTLSLSPLDRAKLRSLPADERLQQVEQRLTETERHRQHLARLNAGRSENELAFQDWLREDVIPALLASDQLDKLLADTPLRRRERLKLAPPDEQARVLREYLASLIVRERVQQLVLTEELVAKLEARLRPPLRMTLEEAATLKQKQALITSWVRAAMKARMKSRDGVGPPSVELQRFYSKELSAEERAELDKLPPEQFWGRLRELYREDRMLRGEPPLPPPGPRAHGAWGRPPRPGGPDQAR